MAVAAHHDEVGGRVRRVRQERARDVGVGRDDALDLDLEAMAREVLADVGAGDLVALRPFARDDHHVDRLGAREQRHRVRDRARRVAARVPADHHAVELEAGLLDVGDDQHRPAGAEQRALDDQFLRRDHVGLGLADHREIEAARDRAEAVGGAGEARAQHARFERNAGAPRRRVEFGASHRSRPCRSRRAAPRSAMPGWCP